MATEKRRSVRLLPSPGAALRDLKNRHAGRQAAAEQAPASDMGNVDLASTRRASPPDPAEQEAQSISASYFMLRLGLAILALAFPIVLIVFGGRPLQGSLSAYYHYSPVHPLQIGGGAMRNIFVGALWAIGVFMVLYQGYSRREDWALNVAGFAAILIACFPMDWPVKDCASNLHSRFGSITNVTHMSSAILFFASIAVVCLFCANETLNILRHHRLRQRLRIIYAVLGVLMLAVPLVTFIAYHSPEFVGGNKRVLIIEVTGVLVFAVYWIVKTYEILQIEWE